MGEVSATFSDVALANLSPEDRYRLYCCKDSFGTILSLQPMIDDANEFGLLSLYKRIAHPLARVIIGMNRRGLLLDPIAKDNAIVDFEKQIAIRQKQLNEYAGRELLNDSSDLRRLLYEEMGLIPPCMTASGKHGAVDETSLKDLAAKYPDIAPLFDLQRELRGLNKTKSTFLEGIVPDQDGRVHPSFKIGPVTGRLACRKPNFQNIPVGPGREMFLAPKGKLFVYADFRQLQVRIFFVLGEDKGLLAALAAGEDPHDYNTRQLFELPPDVKVNVQQRKFGKTFFFGHLLFGGRIETIKTRGGALSYDIPIEQFQRMSDEWFAKRPTIKELRRKTEDDARSKRCVTSPYGRPRMLFDPKIEDAISKALNHPIQAAEADLVSESLIEVDKALPETLVLQVHDSIMLEVDKERAEEVKDQFVGILERPRPFIKNYSFPVEAKIGEHWSDFS